MLKRPDKTWLYICDICQTAKLDTKLEDFTAASDYFNQHGWKRLQEYFVLGRQKHHCCPACLINGGNPAKTFEVVFKVGNRVKVSPVGEIHYPRLKNKFGTVAHNPSTKYAVNVRWDGNVTGSKYDVCYIEKVDNGTP